MKKLLPTMLAVALASTTHFALAAEEQTPTDSITGAEAPMSSSDLNEVEQALDESAKPEPIDPGMQIEDAIAAYKQGEGRGFVTKAREGKLYFGVGQASVMLRPEDRNWGNAVSWPTRKPCSMPRPIT